MTAAPDSPLTHIALPVRNLDQTLAFYQRYTTIAIPTGPGLGFGPHEVVAAANPYELPGSRLVGTTTGIPDRFVGDR